MGASRGSTAVVASGHSNSHRQLQALVVTFIDRTWLGSLEGGCGSVNPQNLNWVLVALIVVVAVAL
jgi:hypothetical protein